MSQKNSTSNPEVINLQNTLQKLLLEANKQSNEDGTFLYLLISLLSLKDGLLGVNQNKPISLFQEQIKLDVQLIPKSFSNNRRLIYQMIFDQMNKHGYHIFLAPLFLQNLGKINFDQIGSNEFIMVFENLLVQISEIKKGSFTFSTLPKEIVDLVFQIDNRPDIDIFNPFSGNGEFSLNTQVTSYIGIEPNPIKYVLHLLRILTHNIEEFILPLNDEPIYELQNFESKYDLIVAKPPIELFNGNFEEDSEYGFINNLEQFFFINALKKLKPEGKIIAIVPQRILISGGINVKIRKKWIINDLLDMVVALPRIKSVFDSDLQIYMVVLNNKKVDKGVVKFIDARSFLKEDKNKKKHLEANEIQKLMKLSKESEFVRVLTNDQIISNEYRLAIGEYLAKRYEGKALSELCTIITGNRRGFTGETGRLVRISDLKGEKFNYILNSTEIELGSINKYKEINESCMLLALIGGKLKPTYFNYTGDSIYIHPNIIALKVDETLVDINYLINELYQEKVLEQLDLYNYGSVISSISKNDILKIVVDISGAPKEQRRVIEKIESSVSIHNAALQDSVEYIEKIKKEFKDDLRIKKHNIMQFMNNIISSAEVLKFKLEINNGILNANDLINTATGTNVKMQFDNLIQSSKTALQYIDHLTDEIKFDKKENLNINDLIEDSIRQGIRNENKFEIEYNFKKESFDVTINDPFIEKSDKFTIDPISFVSRNDFYIIYNNILENADRHGFKDENKKYLFKIDLFLENDGLFSDSLSIIFSNNGKPFPEGMAKFYSLRGEKAGEDANEGIGAWKICEIIREHFHGKIEVIDNPNEEFPVQIRIKLPIVGFE